MIVGEDHEIGVAFPRVEPGEQGPQFGELLIEPRGFRDRQGAAQLQPDRGAFLVGQFLQAGDQPVHVNLGGEVLLQHGEAPAPGPDRLHPRGCAGDLHEQDVAWVGLAAGGHLRGARVPDPGSHLGEGMPVPQDGEVNQAITDPRSQGRIVDGGQRIPVRVETGHRAVPHQDPGHALGRGPQSGAGLGHEIDLRALREPGRCHHLNPGHQLDGLRALRDDHVGGASVHERPGPVDGGGVQGVVVARDQQHRDRAGAQGLEGP